MLKNPFTSHPASVGESYLQHAIAAGSFAARLAFASFVCLLHALFPFVFVKTGSRLIEQLHSEMVENRNARNADIA